MDSSFIQVKNWLLDSGIFVSESDNENYGGVYSFFDEEKKSFSFLYPEITGYYASTMRFLHSHDEQIEFVKRAKASCNWLAKLFDSNGGIIQGIYPNGKSHPFVYSFDTAICAKGMFDCYKISNEEKYLTYGKKFNLWIINNALTSDGTIKPLYNLESQKFEPSTDVWYKQYGCLHIKLTMSLLSEYSITKERSLLEYAENIANQIINFQDDDGSIRLHLDDKVINLHTMCYALEGLLFLYSFTKNEKYLNYCMNALQWCDDQIISDGSIDLWFNSKYHSKSSYPIAQIIRLKILISKINNSSNKTVPNLMNFLISLQATDRNSMVKGGFYEEFHKSLFSWKKRLRVNSWGSMFALQALYWHEHLSDIDFEQEIELLY